MYVCVCVCVRVCVNDTFMEVCSFMQKGLCVCVCVCNTCVYI